MAIRGTLKERSTRKKTSAIATSNCICSFFGGGIFRGGGKREKVFALHLLIRGLLDFHCGGGGRLALLVKGSWG